MTATSSKRRRITTGERARSIPYKRSIVGATALTVVFYLGIIGLLAALFAFFSRQDEFSASILVGFVVGSVVLWLLSFLKRRNARCPLCKGTPLLDSGAHRHVHARRLFPLNYGTTAVLGCIFRQRYICQYCGTSFDLLKTPYKQATARQ